MVAVMKLTLAGLIQECKTLWFEMKMAELTDKERRLTQKILKTEAERRKIRKELAYHGLTIVDSDTCIHGIAPEYCPDCRH